MLTRNPQANSFQLAKPDRRADRSNNSFATATDLGVYQGGSFTFRSSGTLSKSDPVDYFKFRVIQGASWSKAVDVLKVRSGGLRYTSYADFGSGITKTAQTQFAKGNYRQSYQGTTIPFTFTVYLKYDRPKGTTRYQTTSLFF